MDWQPLWTGFTARLRRWLGRFAPSKHRRPVRRPPRARIAVCALEEIASPTLMSASAAATEVIRSPLWDSQPLGDVSNVALTAPSVRILEAEADGIAVGWEPPFADSRTGSSTLDVTAGTSAGESTGIALDDPAWSALDFSHSTIPPAFGVERGLGVACGLAADMGGIAAHFGVTAWPASAAISSPIDSLPELLPTHGLAASGPPLATGQAPGRLANAASTSEPSHGLPAPVAPAASKPISATPTVVASTASSPASSSLTTSGSATPQLSQGPYIVSHNGADIIPLVYASTASDPARELIEVNSQAQGQNPMSQAFSAAGVRYADGTLALTQPDISGTGFASAWGQTLTWTNNSQYLGSNTSTNPVGNGWDVSQLPYLLSADSGNTIDFITSGTNAYIFDQNGGVWSPRYFLQNSLTDSNTTHEFRLTDDTGRVMTFMDFSSSVPTSEQGTFVGLTDPYGNQISVVSRNSSGQITEVQSSSTQNGVSVVQSYVYAYITSGTNAGLLQSVTFRMDVGNTGWQVPRQVTYAYYDGTTSYGNAGDLQTATIEDGSGNALGTYYYRYYTSTGGGGYQHGLEYWFDPRSYARLAAAYPSPLTATNTQVAPYANGYFQYDSSQRTTEAVIQGPALRWARPTLGWGRTALATPAAG